MKVVSESRHLLALRISGGVGVGEGGGLAILKKDRAHTDTGVCPIGSDRRLASMYITHGSLSMQWHTVFKM